nr:replication protein A 70 kDa DNA-binding subunit B-like isoform X2 [Coffea arabica]
MELQEDRKVIAFAEIIPGLRDWTTIVQVLDKQKPLLSKAGNRYQKLTLIDGQGTTVEAMIYKSDIEFFRNHFRLYMRYMLSNARVEYTPLEYRVRENQCTWYIDNSTVVQAMDEPNPPEIPPVFRFTPFRRFYQHIDDTSDIDILGIVAEVHQRFHKGTTPTREIVIIDKSFMPVILTLWGDHETNEGQAIANMIQSMPLIVGLRLRVSSYHTLNLSTKFGSSVLVNPPIQQGSMLRQWAMENKTQINDLITQRAYLNRTSLLPQPTEDELCTIKEFLNLPMKKAYWIQGSPRFLDKSQRLWYNACSNCHKSFRAKPQWKIICTSCNKNVNILPRSRLTIELADYSGNLTLDLYDNDAQQLLPFTLPQIQELEGKHQLDYTAIEQAIESSILTCFVKKMTGNRGPADTEKYAAIIVHKANAAELISSTSRNSASTSTPSTNPLTAPESSNLTTSSTILNATAQSYRGATNLDSNLFTTLKITETPTKKQRTDPTDMEL